MLTYLLNTENYEPVFRATQKVCELVRQNDAIIERLNQIVDVKILLPQETLHGHDSQNEEGAKDDEYESHDDEDVGANDKSDIGRSNKFGRRAPESPGADYLRSFLDNQLKIASVPCAQFERVQNPKVRQLLQDNYRLAQIRELKQGANRQLLQIHAEYHQLLKTVAIPCLTKDVYEHRMSQSRAERPLVDKSIAQSNSLWQAYAEYLQLLYEIRDVAERFVAVIGLDVDDAEKSRLRMQLEIIARLKAQLDAQSLERIRHELSSSSHLGQPKD